VIPWFTRDAVVLIELYVSVQGESSFAGLPCIFVRLAGCNLRCSWCDSEYTFHGGEKFSLDQVEENIAALAPVKLVEFTGGEPMLQERELLPMMDRLLAKGYELMLETSGERPLAKVPKAVHKIMDVKCPASGESGRFHLDNLEALTSRDEVKFVISDRADYEFARDFIRQHDLASRCGNVLLSPAFTKTPTPQRTADNCVLDPRLLVEWMLADHLPARLSLQIHKFIWEPLKKGV
jgi:7-carboxy-7-deazaguanine synthase